MAATRSAHHAISGLSYQFDKSILSVLGAVDDTPVVLEGIEDIDIGPDCIQCKYHSTQRYTRSLIRKPLLAFLQHFTAVRSHRYTLYAHFHDTSGFLPIDLNELKLILDGEASGLGLSDDDLAIFLAGHFRFEHAADYGTQLVKVHNCLMDTLRCSDDEAGMYFYPNALHEVIRLSRQPTEADRTTTRREFLSVINKRHILYSVWLCRLKDARDYVVHTKSELRRLGAFKPSLKKFLFLDADLASVMGTDGFVVLCETLIDNYYKLGTSLKTAYPPTVIVDTAPAGMNRLKAALFDRRICLNDGYEHLAFQPWAFNSPPVINVCRVSSTRTNDRICASSYLLRLISRSTFDAHGHAIECPDVLISTGPVRSSLTQPAGCHRHFHLTEVDTHRMLIDVLTPMR